MKKIIKIMLILMLVAMTVFSIGCNQADTMKNNIQKEANKFNVYRKITFVNLYTGQLLYSAEGYFSVQSTYENNYQGQQEIGLVFNVAKNEYKMDYFSIAENVCYVIEQVENTTGNPYHWKIVWYIALPENVGG
jgi:hypothetical protein|nr:MAG TPA: protein of unknown function (DUF4972) [Caudoviricetes sp.]